MDFRLLRANEGEASSNASSQGGRTYPVRPCHLLSGDNHPPGEWRGGATPRMTLNPLLNSLQHLARPLADSTVAWESIWSLTPSPPGPPVVFTARDLPTERHSVGAAQRHERNNITHNSHMCFTSRARVRGLIGGAFRRSRIEGAVGGGRSIRTCVGRLGTTNQTTA